MQSRINKDVCMKNVQSRVIIYAFILLLVAVISLTVMSQLYSPRVTTVPSEMNVKIFFIALEDDGKSGKKIGCNDSAVGVGWRITPTLSPMKKALEALLSVKDQHYGQSGLYNALSSANLQADDVRIENGKATINLSGSYEFTGVCEDARFIAQIEETAMQFNEVKNVEIILNGRSLKNMYKGE